MTAGGSEPSERSTNRSSTSENCERCQILETALRDSELNVAELGQQLAGLEHSLRRAGSAEVALRNELAKVREDEPESDDVKELLGLWREECKAGDKRVKIGVSGDRGAKVKRMLKRYGKERLATAVMGATLDDWAMGRDRRTNGRQYNDIAKHILKDEETIERFEKLWQDRLNPQLPAAAPTPSPTARNPKPASYDPCDELLTRLDAVKAAGQEKWTARCPAHEDRHASLSVARGTKGVVVRCHAGCSHDQIAAAISLPLTDWFHPEIPVTPAAPVAIPNPLPSLQQVAEWTNQLHRHEPLLDRIHAVKGWTRTVLLELGVGWDGERIVFPVFTDKGELASIARYLPGAKPKMLGLSGRPRGLFPAPERSPERSRVLWLVEGEPDGVTAAQLGLAGSGVPGVNGWHTEWSPRFAGRNVVVCMDSDQPGRDAAIRITNALAGIAADIRIVDLDPARDDGFDLTDYALGGGTKDALCELASNATPIRGLAA